MKKLIRGKFVSGILASLMIVSLGCQAGFASKPASEFLTGAAFAQAKEKWVKMPGLMGGSVNALAVIDGRLYAGAAGGSVFVSTDQGGSWKELESGLPGMAIISLAVSGTNIFAGTEGGGVYRSNDQGRTWVAANAGLPPEGTVIAMAISGTALLAVLRGNDSGVYRTTDQGRQWRAVHISFPSPPSQVDVVALLVSGADIFAATVQDGLFQSTDQGQSWIRTSLTQAWTFSLAADDENLFVGLFDGVYRSTDRGRTWMKADAGLPPEINVRALAISRSHLFAGTLGGRIYRSTDHGQSWADLTPAFCAQSEIKALAVLGETIFAASDCGVLRSIDQGKSWVAVNNGLRNGAICDLTVSGTSLFTETGAGLLRSTDRGRSWRKVKAEFVDQRISSIAAIGHSLFVVSDGRVFHSSNQGYKWRVADSGWMRGKVIAIHRSGDFLFGWPEMSQVYRSGDHGKTWTEIILPPKMRKENGGNEMQPRFLASTKTSLFLFVSEQASDVDICRIYRSTDQGQSWTPADEGIEGGCIEAVTVSGADIFIGTSGGVIYRSTDEGQNWTAVNEDLYVRVFAISGEKLYAATNGEGVFLSTNRGRSWRAINAGLTRPFIHSLAVSGRDLFAGACNGGLFRLTESR